MASPVCNTHEFIQACERGELARAKQMEATAGAARDALEAAGLSNQVATAQWLMRRFGLGVSDLRANNNALLRECCSRGHTDMVRWLADAGLTADDARAMNNLPLRYACMLGHLDIVRLLVNRFGLTAQDVRTENCLALHMACGHRMEIADWLMRRFRGDLSPETDLRAGSRALLMACEDGRLDNVRRLISKYGLTAEEVRADDNAALRMACEEGHLAIAQLLAENFGLTIDDARAHSNEALLTACEQGRLDVAQWLARYFRLTPADARSPIYYSAHKIHALFAACSNGHLEVARWLVDAFGLGAADADDDALGCAYENGHTHVIEWLVRRFKYTADNTSTPRDILRDACVRGSLADMQWAAELFAPSSEVVHDLELLTEAAAAGFTGIVEWLATSYYEPGSDNGEVEQALHAACERGHQAAAEWLAVCYGISPGDDQLRAACAGGHLATVEWLVTRYHLGDSSFVHDACAGGHTGTANWLVSRFGWGPGRHEAEAGASPDPMALGGADIDPESECSDITETSLDTSASE